MNRLRVLILILVGALISSCQPEEDVPQDQLTLNEVLANDMDGMTVLGAKLENPYSVTNMKKAWESLKKKSKVDKTGEIVTTHLYIKFKPKTEEELSILKRDSTLVLYDYPMDHEIEENGSFYHDPEIPIGQPTYQYAAIVINKELPNGVEHEILEELFIPDEDEDHKENPKTSFASK